MGLRIVIVKKKQENKKWVFSSLKKAGLVFPELCRNKKIIYGCLKEGLYEDSEFTIERLPFNQTF